MKLRHKKKAALAATLILFGPLAGGANAALLFEITQQGSDLLITSSGSIDTNGLTLSPTVQKGDYFQPSQGLLLSRESPVPSSIFDQTAFSIQVPAFGSSVGSGGFSLDVFSSNTGAMSGLGFWNDFLYLPNGYVSGASLDGTAIFANQSFASMGLTQGGSFVGTLNNTTLETVTVSIVPEPCSVILLGLSAVGLVGSRRRGIKLV